MKWYYWLLLLLPGLPHAVAAQTPVVIPRIQGEIRLDGVVDERAWEAAAPLPMVMHLPTFGGEPTERTEIRVAHDGVYFYVSARLFDSEPDLIQAATKKRDATNLTSDFFGVILDTFNDNENALGFFTFPPGQRTDIAFSNDAEGSQQAFFNDSWNTFWQVATSRDGQGWYAEMRIPFTSLRFQERDGQVVMGLIAWRWIARKYESSIYPAIPNQWGWWSQVKPSQAQDVILEGVEDRRPFYLTPYLLGGLGQDYRLNDAETAYYRRDDPTFNAGLDLKYGLNSNLTLDLTANTDFAQVEADDQQVNLTRFSLFFPEKRMFFQERASIFDFGAQERTALFDLGPGTASRLFYSRRIGLYEGHKIRLLGGARIVGRVGGWDIGALNMQTARDYVDALEEELPSENFGVLRLRRRVLNPYSYVGGMTTSRIGEDGTYNLAYGLDGAIRVTGDEYLTFNWAQTFEDDLNREPFSLDGARLYAAWARRTATGIGYDASVTRSGSRYNPGIGFELRDNYSHAGGRIFYGYLAGESSRLLRRTVTLEGDLFTRNEDRSVESALVQPSVDYLFKSGAEFIGGVSLYHESLLEPFDLSDQVAVPAGRYTFAMLNLRYDTPSSGLFNAQNVLNVGTFYDGRRVSATVVPTWSLSSDLELSLFYQYNRITFAERDARFNAHVGRLRLQATFTTRFSAATFVQYVSAGEAVVANVRLRYNPREGNDFYLVFNEGLNTNRSGFDPLLPRTSNRTILVKYTYTFAF